jgi:hypothetical protein
MMADRRPERESASATTFANQDSRRVRRDDAAMTKWEYGELAQDRLDAVGSRSGHHTINFYGPDGHTRDLSALANRIRALSILGDEGWEAYAFDSEAPSSISNRHRFYLKRSVG